MAEYIERSTVMYYLEGIATADEMAMNIAKAVVKRIPAADVEPVRHGRWLDNEDYMFCSECGMHWNYFDNDTQDFKCCPNCGAKMDGGAE